MCCSIDGLIKQPAAEERGETPKSGQTPPVFCVFDHREKPVVAWEREARACWGDSHTRKSILESVGQAGAGLGQDRGRAEAGLGQGWGSAGGGRGERERERERGKERERERKTERDR